MKDDIFSVRWLGEWDKELREDVVTARARFSCLNATIHAPNTVLIFHQLSTVYLATLTAAYTNGRKNQS